jgi:acetyl esterase/lipase
VRPLRLAAALLVAATLSACSGSSSPSATSRSGPTVQYLPGRFYAPAGSPPAAVLVVLVPGGGWRTADDTGLRPLAERLAGKGIAAATIRYRAAVDGAHYPVPAQDVSCGIAWAAQRASRAGSPPSRVVVAGHSAGAHLAALAALVPERVRGTCPFPAVNVSALVGLAGPYDIRRFEGIAASLIGQPLSAAPATWRAANAMTWTGRRPTLPVLLLHGRADTVVDVSSTREFAAALRRGGHPVRTLYLAGVGHGEIHRADVAGPALEAWLPTLG